MVHFLQSIGAFAVHLFAALALLGGFLLAYARTTPHDELGLIRKGNTAAAIGFGGALVGYAFVLSRAISYSDNVLETILWGLVGLIVQIAGHMLLARVMPRLYSAIEENDTAAGIMKAAVAISLGMINAASMTP